MKTLSELAGELNAGTTSAVALAEATLAEIEARDESIHAFLEVYDDVLAQAAHADNMRADGKATPLTGIPIVLKDNMLLSGKRVGAASKILEGYVAPYTATAVQKLQDAGAVFIGRANCDEFAMGSSTENSAYGPTKNPHDETRVPGGSSGGSAAAVAAGFVPAALGSDTGGSIRQPASFCGVVGLKPTYGSVSRNGLIAMGSSLDVIGPFAQTVDDARTLFEVIKGNDPMDSTTLPDNAYVSHERKQNLVVGVPRAFVSEGIDTAVAQAFEKTLEGLAREGHEIVDIALPYIKHALAVYYVIMPAEVSTNLSRFDGVKYGLQVAGDDLLGDYVRTRREGFGPEPRRRTLLGTYVLSAGYYDAYYGKATQVREMIRDDFSNAFKNVDVIATPTAPTPPFKIGEIADPLSMYLADIFTVPANIAGIPGISVPMPSKSALPMGIQFLAAHTREDLLFHIGEEVEALK